MGVIAFNIQAIYEYDCNLYRSEGSLERDISSLRALGPGGGQISRVVHVSTRAAFGVFVEKYGFVQEGHTFLAKSMVSYKRGAHLSKKCGFV